MTELERQLKVIGADSIAAITLPSSAWEQFCTQHTSLFAKANQRNPDKPVTHALLGILTKAHMEETSYLEAQIESIQTMQEVLLSNLGQDNAAKFKQRSSEQLTLVTHLWLYLQGFLSMDFSLANDHADNTAHLIARLDNKDPQLIRTQFLASYYHGIERSTTRPKTSSGLLGWLKKRLGN